ncbi:MAG: HAMP domain-containing sensor histidine kinase [Pseudomonadota bacterium]
MPQPAKADLLGRHTQSDTCTATLDAAAELNLSRPRAPVSATLSVDASGIVSASNREAAHLLGHDPVGVPWADLKSRWATDNAADSSASRDALFCIECDRCANGAHMVVLFERERVVDTPLSPTSESASVLAHQLRTPLSAATLYVSHMAGATDLSPQHQRWLSRTLEQLSAAERMVGNLAMFSRDSAFATETLRLADLVEGLEAGCETHLRRAGIRCSYRVADDAMPLLGNRVALVSALSNIVTNACQHAPTSTLTVTAGIGINGRGTVVIRDTGPGFPSDLDLAASQSADELSLNGLGLTVARRVVEQHGGALVASNHPDGGAQVCVELPLARCAADSVEVSI